MAGMIANPRVLVAFAAALLMLAALYLGIVADPWGTRNAYCHMVGNSAERQYCMTTFTQILAAPELYDGRRVAFHAWVVETQGVLAAFPTTDSMDSAELNASIRIGGGSGIVDLKSMLRSSSEHRRRVQLQGVLRVHWPSSGKGASSPRFGEIDDLEGASP